MTTVTRRFWPELPAATRSLAPCPTRISAEAGIPWASRKDATVAARSYDSV